MFQLENGEIVVVIVHCTNCESHAYMTNHISAKYLSWAQRTKEAIEERFPQVKVYLKSNQVNRVNPTILDHYAAAQGLGAFEVILF